MALQTLETWHTFDRMEITLTQDAPPVESEFSFVVGDSANIIGQERDILVSVTSGHEGRMLSLSVTDNTINIASPSDLEGIVEIQYDGLDSSEELNYTGLGGVNLKARDAVGFGFAAETDHETVVDFEIFTNADRMCYASVVLNPSEVLVEYYLTFAQFSGDCAFADVGAIVVRIYAREFVDVIVSQIYTVGYRSIDLVRPIGDRYFDFEQECFVQPPRPETTSTETNPIIDIILSVSLSIQDYFSFSFNIDSTLLGIDDVDDLSTFTSDNGVEDDIDNDSDISTDDGNGGRGTRSHVVTRSNFYISSDNFVYTSDGGFRPWDFSDSNHSNLLLPSLSILIIVLFL